MSRTILLRTLSAAALAAAYSTASQAGTPSVIVGGGATSPQANYAEPNDPSTNAPRSEFSLFNSTSTAVQFGSYVPSSSGTGQQAFIQNDQTCNTNKQSGANGGKCSNVPAGANTVHYALSDNVLSTAQIASWATVSYGQSRSGNLIQLPMLGTATTFPIKNTKLTKNGGFSLSDADLCGIFSGLISDFSQITDAVNLTGGAVTPTAGPIKVVYRTDSAATTYLLTNHLSAPNVCPSGTTPTGFTFTATTTFATLFPGQNSNGVITGALATRFIGKSGNAGVANYLAGLSDGPVTNAIGYVPPDWTTITKAGGGGTVLSNGKPSPLLVASVLQGTTPVLPSIGNIGVGLKNPAQGFNLTPPTTAAAGAIPSNWVPVIQTTKLGYPIVGYGTIDLAQCYADPAIRAGIIRFLTAHYTNASYKTIQKAHGLVSLANTPGAKFYTTISQRILTNGGTGAPWNLNIGNTTACNGKAGR